MDTQGKIIALLQGELRDRREVEELIHHLAESPEGTDLFLKHIDLSRQISLLGKAALSVPNPARQLVRDRIDKLEADRELETASRLSGESKFTSRFGRSHPILTIGLALLVTASTAWIGYFVGTRNAATTPADKDPLVTTDKSAHGLPASPKEQEREEDSPSRPESFPKPHAAGSRSNQWAVTSSSTRWMPANDISAVSLRADRDERPQTQATSDLSLPSESSTSPITLLAPRGGEIFQSGDILPIVWSGNSTHSPMTVELSADGGLNWSLLADNVTEDRLLWNVPEDAKSGSKYLLKVRPLISSAVRPSPLRFITADTSDVCLAVSPDGRYLITGGNNTMLSVWNLQTGDRIAHLSGHGAPIHSCRYNAEGSKIITASLDGTAITWDVATWKAEHMLDAKRTKYHIVWCAAYSPDGKTIATAHEDGSIVFWDAKTGKQLSVLERYSIHDEGVRYIEFTPDGTRLLTASTDRSASILDIKTGKRLQRFVHHTITRYVRAPSRIAMRNANVNAIQLTRDDSIAITCGHDGAVRFWNAKTGKLIRSRIYHGGLETSMVRLSPDGKILASLGYDGTLAIIDPRTGGVIDRVTVSTDTTALPMVYMDFTPDSQTLALAQNNGRVSIWDIRQHGDISSGYWGIKGSQN